MKMTGFPVVFFEGEFTIGPKKGAVPDREQFEAGITRPADGTRIPFGRVSRNKRNSGLILSDFLQNLTLPYWL